MPFRAVAACLALSLASPAFVLPAQAQQTTFIVGFAAGGSADSIARLVGQRLTETTGAKIVVENRPGAGANIAAKAVLSAAADGSTLLVTTTALAINETLYRNKGFSARDLKPVAVVATSPEVFAVHPENGPKSLADLVAQARKSGQSISFGTAGIGTSSHIAGEYFFKEIAKVEARHVPFRGGPDATNAMMGGHLPLAVSSLSGFAQQMAAGQIKGLAIGTAQRVPVVKDVPTFEEAGYPGFTAASFVGFFAPGGAPQAQVERLNGQIDAIAKEPAVRERLVALGFEPVNGDAAQTKAYVERQIEQWRVMVEKLGVSVE